MMRGSSRRSVGQRVRSARRASPSIEAMEGRALMAAGPLAVANLPATLPAIQFQTGPSFNVVTVVATNRPLVEAVRTLLADLDATFGENGTGPTDQTAATFQTDLASIGRLAGPASQTAVDRLGTAVNGIVASATLTATQRRAVVADVNAILSLSGITGVVASSSSGFFASMNRSLASNILSRDDLTDPNAVGTSSAGTTRGQAATTAAVPTSSLPTPSGLPGSGIFGLGYRRLLEDFKAALAKSQAITPAQRDAARRDLVEVVASAHRPDADAVAKLRADLQALADGDDADAGARVKADFRAVLGSAGVSDALIDRTVADFQPILDAADLDPTALRSILSDLASLLSAKPRSVSPLGSWWLGGRPR